MIATDDNGCGTWLIIGVVILAVVALMAVILQLAWGWILVPIFGFAPLTFWQAVGIWVFIAIVKAIT